MSKPVLEHVIVVNPVVNFSEMNRSGGSLCFTCICCAQSLQWHRLLLVLVPTGGGDSEYRLVVYSTSVHSAELDERKGFSPLTYVVLEVFGSLALFGVPNYQCHSTMGILQVRTISCSIRYLCVQYHQIEPQYDCRRMN